MVHGEEKAREMVRSLLPSTQRENARRDRSAIHRTHRRHFRKEMRQLTRDPDAFDDRADLGDGPVKELRILVRYRRSADKIPPFLRWATARARPLPRDSRLSHIRALVPRGLIGDHALSHLQHASEFQSSHRLALDGARGAAYRARSCLMNRGEQAEWLRALLSVPKGHRVFNLWLKACHLLQHHEKLKDSPESMSTALPPVRLLQGVHDVLPFLAAIWGKEDLDRRPAPLEGRRSAVHTFLRTLKQHRGDVEATTRALGLAPRLLD